MPCFIFLLNFDQPFEVPYSLSLSLLAIHVCLQIGKTNSLLANKVYFGPMDLMTLTFTYLMALLRVKSLFYLFGHIEELAWLLFNCFFIFK